MPRRWGPTTVLLMYVAVTVALWFAVYFSERCWNWENAHLTGDLSRRDTCLAIWWPSTLVLITTMVFALVVLITNTFIKLLLFAPAIH